MNGTLSLLTTLEREVLSWPGVAKETHPGGQGQGGFRVPPAAVSRLGHRELGHIHVTGEADLPFPRKLHDDLITAGRARAHGAGCAGAVTYAIR